MLRLIRPTLLLRFRSDMSSKDKSKKSSKSSSKPSNTPRPPKDPPDEGYAPESVNHEDMEVSDFVNPEAFRQFSSPEERLGPGAGKNKEYKNAHYFGYHRFSFVVLQNQSLEVRDERRIGGGVQVITEADEQEDSSDDSLESIKQQEAECDEQLAAQAKDIENEKLKAWCDSIEKKQRELAELQMSNQSDENKDQVKTSNEKQKEEDQIKTTIDKKIAEILTECEGKLGKDKAEPTGQQNKASIDCKELIKAAADKAALPAKGKGQAEDGGQEPRQETEKTEDAESAEELAKLKATIEKCEQFNREKNMTEKGEKPEENQTENNLAKCKTDKDETK
ncbi:caldesmon [Drosophila virilis]|uniref:Uncharacterized protein n=1 Tax=Drosophila virilis TaxID=7244 RepID=B4LQI5_DROVI|nr:uncharacterized protein LOC6627553 [Drosophila virilis]EDW64442.2 uncharacterized protein Dvir_GJ22516 [Drosophila virilis]